MNKDYFLYFWHNATPSVVFFLLSSIFSHLLWLQPPDLCMKCVDWNEDAWCSLQNANTSNVVGVKFKEDSVAMQSNRQWSVYHTDGASGTVLKLCTVFVRCVKLLSKNNYHP